MLNSLLQSVASSLVVPVCSGQPCGIFTTCASSHGFSTMLNPIFRLDFIKRFASVVYIYCPDE